MKKILSALIPMLTLISILVSNNIFAFAETTKYWEPRPNCQDTIACVNDKEYSDDIKMSYNNDSEQFAISYNGKGVVTNWEFPLSQEDKDYKIISQSNNTIYIKLINKTQELPYINAIVDFRESTTTQSTGQTGNNSTAESNKTEEKTSEIITTDITGRPMSRSYNTVILFPAKVWSLPRLREKLPSPVIRQMQLPSRQRKSRNAVRAMRLCSMHILPCSRMIWIQQRWSSRRYMWIHCQILQRGSTVLSAERPV